MEMGFSKTYNPKEFEDKIYKKWLDFEVFLPNENLNKKFSMVAPPPNVTGVLHIGHGLNFVLQDILVRYKKMKGYNTLWLFGTDHAGIATQSVFERELNKNDKNREDYTRDEFISEIFKFKEKYRKIIVKQVEKLGVLYDHTRERFTLDEGMSKAVEKAFIDLYNAGLIYKGKYLVNLDPDSGSVISDEEIEYKEVEGKLYYIKYPLDDSFILIATTRPETMFGDTAIAVNPSDERYKSFIGKEVVIPIVNRKIKIISDSYVKMDFGTGAVKITPAHDLNDFKMSERHNLDKINILTKNAKLNEKVPESYQGLNIKEARKKIEEELKDKGYLVSVDSYKHQVGHCYRSGKVVEPYLSNQWFVKMKPLAKKGLDALKRGEIRFIPKRWENTYKHWLNNIKDWCISRQIIWGHRIPAWYDEKTNEIVVSKEDPSLNFKYKGHKFRRDLDVLDTWFSSWLWPFASFGWPNKIDDFKKFYPTDTLVTAYDIIFFWVSKMVIAGLYFTGQVPFKDIYITPLLRDNKGLKMSKSLNNGIDPIQIINEHGSDALRFTLSFLSVQGQDININSKDFMFGAKFVNKVFNASKFILSNLETREIVDSLIFNDVDKWLLSSLNLVLANIDLAFKNYKYNEASKIVYEFFWKEFCDWYIEISKIDLNSSNKELEDMTVSKLVFFLKESLKILHPFIPFITEEIYEKLPRVSGVLILENYPSYKSNNDFTFEYEGFNFFKNFISGIRTLRSEFNIASNIRINVAVKFDESFKFEYYFKSHEKIAKKLINFENIYYNKNFNNMIGVALSGFEVYADIQNLIDKEKELNRLLKQLKKYENLKKGIIKKFENKDFLNNAPFEVIESEKMKIKEFSSFILKINSYIHNLYTLSIK